jgi:hypothetical protein
LFEVPLELKAKSQRPSSLTLIPTPSPGLSGRSKIRRSLAEPIV